MGRSLVVGEKVLLNDHKTNNLNPVERSFLPERIQLISLRAMLYAFARSFLQQQRSYMLRLEKTPHS